MDDLSLRCHAAVTPDGIVRNAVVGCSGIKWDAGRLKARVDSWHVCVFECETHSTECFNGIAVIYPCMEMPHLPPYVSPVDFSETLADIGGRIRFPQKDCRWYMCLLPLR